MTKIFKHWMFLVVFMVALLVGAASFYFSRPALEVLRLARASNSWIATEAKVLSAGIDSTYSSRVGSETNYHTPEVRYEYRVNNQMFEAEQLRFAHLRLRNRAGKARAVQILNPYRDNPVVIAYYNPDNPAQAVLEPGFFWGSLDGLINTGIGFVIAIAILCLAFWLDSPFRRVGDGL